MQFGTYEKNDRLVLHDENAHPRHVCRQKDIRTRENFRYVVSNNNYTFIYINIIKFFLFIYYEYNIIYYFIIICTLYTNRNCTRIQLIRYL